MPDNFIQQPDNTQNYNRYAYVLNNPLMYTDPSGEAYENGYENPSETNQQVGGGIIASVINFFKNPENGEWFRRNAGEIGRFVGRNFESAFKDTSGWIGNQGKSIGKIFSRIFKKPSQFNESKVTSLNYAAVNTTNTISNSFTGGSTVASGGFQSNYGGKDKQSANTFKNRQEVLDYYSDGSNFDLFGERSKFYTTYDTRFEALASFFKITGPEVPTGIVKYFSNLFSLNKAAEGVTPSLAPLKNISGSLDNASALARNQPYGPNTNVFRRLPRNAPPLALVCNECLLTFKK